MNQMLQISMDSLLEFLSKLTVENKKRIADHLYEEIHNHEIEASNLLPDDCHKQLRFPKIPKDYLPSQETLDRVLGPLPNGLDCDQLTDEMWQEFAK
ncbi:MAG: hypothetical protein IJM59_12430 [Proteobacteria bacterium]|nr:hypothetical protein [Pseudomonadota bacterium]